MLLQLQSQQKSGVFQDFALQGIHLLFQITNVSDYPMNPMKNYGELIKDQQYLTQNCQNLVYKLYRSDFEILGKKFSPKSWQYYWILAQSRESENQSD